jgi:hypothetical protein
MLSQETLETYRRMTPSERRALMLQMIEEKPYLHVDPPEVVGSAV